MESASLPATIDDEVHVVGRAAAGRVDDLSEPGPPGETAEEPVGFGGRGAPEAGLDLDLADAADELVERPVADGGPTERGAGEVERTVVGPGAAELVVEVGGGGALDVRRRVGGVFPDQVAEQDGLPIGPAGARGDHERRRRPDRLDLGRGACGVEALCGEDVAELALGSPVEELGGEPDLVSVGAVPVQEPVPPAEVPGRVPESRAPVPPVSVVPVSGGLPVSPVVGGLIVPGAFP